MFSTIRKGKYGNYNRLLLATLLNIILFSCREHTANRKIEPGFYYWKSVFKITGYELLQLDSLHVKTMYLKFFDVDWDDVSNQFIPKAKLQVTHSEVLLQYKIIPVVFITNECIQRIDSVQIFALANKTSELIKNTCAVNGIHAIDEVQIDCDWTLSTRKKYFSLLSELKKQMKTNISATIRLHQIKYLSQTGVPPVYRGMLMCYNMGNLKIPAIKNSIIDTKELQKYTGNLSRYPLPLDVAFPLFEWKVLFRENTYMGLIQNLSTETLGNTIAIKKGNRFEILKDTLLAGYDLKKGDVLRDERSPVNEVIAAAAIINKHLKNPSLRIALYHLDSLILSKYSSHEMERIYNSLH